METTDSAPPGIRNKNPGNLRDVGIPWIGLIGADNGFCVFKTDFYGIRALSRNLVTYFQNGFQTPRQVITKWAPPTENDTGAYLIDVCHRTGYTADQMIDLTDSTTNKAVTMAIIWHENAQQPYGDDLLTKAIANALRE